MSLCFRAWGADPLRSVMAMRCCLRSMLGFLCVLWKRFVRAHLPLAGPRSFTNHVITALWFLLTKNWYNYMLEIFMFSFLETDLSFPEISGRVFHSGFFFCSALVDIWLSFIHVYKGPTSTYLITNTISYCTLLSCTSQVVHFFTDGGFAATLCQANLLVPFFILLWWSVIHDFCYYQDSLKPQVAVSIF